MSRKKVLKKFSKRILWILRQDIFYLMNELDLFEKYCVFLDGTFTLIKDMDLTQICIVSILMKYENRTFHILLRPDWCVIGQQMPITNFWPFNKIFPDTTWKLGKVHSLRMSGFFFAEFFILTFMMKKFTILKKRFSSMTNFQILSLLYLFGQICILKVNQKLIRKTCQGSSCFSVQTS